MSDEKHLEEARALHGELFTDGDGLEALRSPESLAQAVLGMVDRPEFGRLEGALSDLAGKGVDVDVSALEVMKGIVTPSFVAGLFGAMKASKGIFPDLLNAPATFADGALLIDAEKLSAGGRDALAELLAGKMSDARKATALRVLLMRAIPHAESLARVSGAQDDAVFAMAVAIGDAFMGGALTLDEEPTVTKVFGEIAAVFTELTTAQVSARFRAILPDDVPLQEAVLGYNPRFAGGEGARVFEFRPLWPEMFCKRWQDTRGEALSEVIGNNFSSVPRIAEKVAFAFGGDGAEREAAGSDRFAFVPASGVGGVLVPKYRVSARAQCELALYDEGDAEDVALAAAGGMSGYASRIALLSLAACMHAKRGRFRASFRDLASAVNYSQGRGRRRIEALARACAEIDAARVAIVMADGKAFEGRLFEINHEHGGDPWSLDREVIIGYGALYGDVLRKNHSTLHHDRGDVFLDLRGALALPANQNVELRLYLWLVTQWNNRRRPSAGNKGVDDRMHRPYVVVDSMQFARVANIAGLQGEKRRIQRATTRVEKALTVLQEAGLVELWTREGQPVAIPPAAFEAARLERRRGLRSASGLLLP